jgi:hypothetical protein
LKKDLKRTKALLRDAQTMLEKTQNEGTNKVILRQLKNQVNFLTKYVIFYRVVDPDPDWIRIQ